MLGFCFCFVCFNILEPYTPLFQFRVSQILGYAFIKQEKLMILNQTLFPKFTKKKHPTNSNNNKKQNCLFIHTDLLTTHMLQRQCLSHIWMQLCSHNPHKLKSQQSLLIKEHESMELTKCIKSPSQHSFQQHNSMQDPKQIFFQMHI